MKSVLLAEADKPQEETPTAQLLRLNKKKPARFGWFLVIGGFCCFLVWAALAPLDKGVAVSGKVIVSGHRKTVQHPSGGIVEQILVKEGQRVIAGEVLLRMNDTAWKTQQQSLYAQFMGSLTTQARLQAERDGLKHPPFSEELMQQAQEPLVASSMRLQQMLLNNRQDSLTMELQGLAASIDGMKQQLQGLRRALTNKQQQQGFIAQQLKGQRELAIDGYIARNRVLDSERLYAQIGADIAEDIGRIGLLQKQIAELTLRMGQRKEDYQKEVNTQLAELDTKTEDLRQRLHNAEFELANSQVRAPASGLVVNMEVFTQGGVISPGQSLMEIVPEQEALLVEAQMAVNLIDKVHAGLPVEIMFPAFAQSVTPRVEGEVTLVSADRLVDDRSGEPYYRLQIKVSETGMQKLQGLLIRPGMPVEAFVRTGERSLLNYLFKPLLDRTHLALGEE